MKKLLTLLALMFLLSCEENCKQCTTTMTGGGVNTTTTFEACGSDIDAVNGKVITSTATINGHSVTVTSKTTCR